MGYDQQTPADILDAADAFIDKIHDKVLANQHRNTYIDAATAERVNGMEFAEWCSRSGYTQTATDGLWIHCGNYNNKITSQLFNLFLADKTK